MVDKPNRTNNARQTHSSYISVLFLQEQFEGIATGISVSKKETLVWPPVCAAVVVLVQYDGTRPT